MSAVALAFGCAGLLVAGLGLFLLSAVVAVALQGKPIDVLSATIAIGLVIVGAVGLRSAWRRRPR